MTTQTTNPDARLTHIPRLLTVAEVAERCGVRDDVVYRLIAGGSGPLRSVRVGRHLRVSEEALAKFIAEGGSL